MDADLKNCVKEIVEIVKECPERLQEKCFELLLNDLLSSRRGSRQPKPPRASTGAEGEVETPGENGDNSVEQADIQDNDLHVKARHFLKKHSLTVANLNQLFYKEGDKFLPLYEDLRTTKGSESQIRIALLQALVLGLASGEFQFDGESVRSECQERKCYDRNNFSANFNNSATLFAGFEKYDKKSPTIKLSERGRKQLAAVIQELECAIS